jgi:septal ring factor EnvC (AmiA/AmiB activator)
MKKRMFVFGVVPLLILIILCGCGISQEQYDAAMADLNQVQNELQSVKDDLQTAKAQLAERTASLDQAENELKSVQGEFTTEQAENLKLTESLEETETKLELKESELESTTEYLSFRDEVNNRWRLLDAYLAINHEILSINAGLCLDDLDMIYQNCTDLTVVLAGI